MKLFSRLFFILFAYFGTQVVVSCCSDVEKEYINVHNFSTQLLQNNAAPKKGTSVDTAQAEAELSIRLLPEFGFVSVDNALFFQNNAFALSKCPKPGESGNKTVATAIEITYQGEQAFNDSIAAGALINDYVRCRLDGFEGEYTVEDLIDLYQKERFAFNQQVTFRLRQKPTNRAVRKFHFKITKTDNSIIEVSTRSVLW